MRFGYLDLLAKGRLARRLLLAFFLIIVALAGAGLMVTTQITVGSLEARAESQLSNGEAIVYLDLGELEERLAFYCILLADAQMLTVEADQPSVARSLMISLLGNLRRSGMHAHLYDQEPAPGTHGADLIRKGFQGLRATSLSRVRVGDGWGLNLESVAPIESAAGVNRVVGVTFPLTRAYLDRVGRRIGSDITLVLEDHFITTLPEAETEALLGALVAADSSGDREEPFLLDTTFETGPAKTRISPFRVSNRREGRLLLTMPMGDLIAARRNIFLKGLLVTSVVLFGAALLYVSLIRRITRPLDQLWSATHDIAAGNLNLRVPVDTDDEVGELARSFNVMVQRLRESRREIEEWNRTLEGRVAERTHSLERAQQELKAANDQLLHALTELRETQNQMIQAERLAAVGQMASTMAHEIKNPLAGIRAALEVVAPELRGGAYESVIKRILDQVDRLGSTTTQLLVFARPSEPAQVPTSLRELIETAHFLVAHQASRQNVEIRMDLAAEDRTIRLDPQLTSQAFLNIILNALQAMEGGGTLTIHSRWIPEGAVTVAFEDTGGGIPPEIRDRIFAPFFTTKRQGTGLGLYAVKDIVERQGGTVEVNTEQGEGTVVTVQLPAVEDVPAR
jgi:signal transduction histidine kinase